MDGFIGEYNHSIDAKGRIIVPQKYREDLGDVFFLSKGLDGCLWISPADEWNSFKEKLRQLPTIDKASRQFRRFFTAGATECEFDKQGRILIPAALRQYAGITKDVVLAGMDTRIEVWSREKWEEISQITDDNMDEIASHLSDLGVNI